MDAVRSAMDNQILALDIGQKRIGVALANYLSRLPRPLVTLANDESFLSKLEEIVKENKVDKIVIGLPSNLSGEETTQTKETKKLAKIIGDKIKLDMVFQDEALSSVRAKEDLINRSKNKQLLKEEVDKLAACYILEDYLMLAMDRNA